MLFFAPTWALELSMSNRFRNGLTVFMLLSWPSAHLGPGYLTRELVNGRGDASLAHADQELFTFISLAFDR